MKLKLKFGRKSLEARKARSGYVFVLPFILGIVLIYLPILADSIWLSFSVFSRNSEQLVITPVGFKYYIEAFTGSESANFISALLGSLQSLVLQVPSIIIFSLFIAVVLNQKMLGRAAFRAIFFVPVIISTGLMDAINRADVIADSASQGIDDGSGGAGTAGFINMMDVERLLADMPVGTELVSIVVGLVNGIFDIINYSGVQMLIFLAGLQSISPSIYEACSIEGATAWETFWKVTFPMISPMILVNAFYTIIDSFTRSNSSVMLFIEKIADRSQQTAMSWIYFMIVLLIIVVVGGVASSFVFYQRRD